MEFKSKDPLHGITLENLLIQLTKRYSWRELFQQVPIQCFKNDPSIKSSLKFLRKTPWAREAVEKIYIDMLKTPEKPGYWKKRENSNGPSWLDKI